MSDQSHFVLLNRYFTEFFPRNISEDMYFVGIPYHELRDTPSPLKLNVSIIKADFEEFVKAVSKFLQLRFEVSHY